MSVESYKHYLPDTNGKKKKSVGRTWNSFYFLAELTDLPQCTNPTWVLTRFEKSAYKFYSCLRKIILTLFAISLALFMYLSTELRSLLNYLCSFFILLNNFPLCSNIFNSIPITWLISLFQPSALSLNITPSRNLSLCLSCESISSNT